MKDLKKKLVISDKALKAVNDFLLDENNPLINDLLESASSGAPFSRMDFSMQTSAGHFRAKGNTTSQDLDEPGIDYIFGNQLVIKENKNCIQDLKEHVFLFLFICCWKDIKKIAS